MFFHKQIPFHELGIIIYNLGFIINSYTVILISNIGDCLTILGFDFQSWDYLTNIKLFISDIGLCALAYSAVSQLWETTNIHYACCEKQNAILGLLLSPNIGYDHTVGIC